VPDRPRAEIEEFVRIAHEVVCLYCVPRQNRRCLTKFVPVPHQNRTRLTQFAPVSHQNRSCLTQFASVAKITESVLPQRFGPLLRRSSTLKAHAFPTRPTDNLTFGTSISQLPATADQPRTVLACWCTSLSHCYSQANLLPSHSYPLDSISQPSPSLSAQLGFPTRSFGW
jgi:hypothetical protein